MPSNETENAAPTSVGADFPRMQAYAREMLAEYRAIGPAGAFGALMIEETLRRADEALASGDVVAILHSYHEMKEIA